MRMNANHFTLVACLAIFTATPALSQQQATDFKNFNPRFEVFELPGGAMGNTVQSIVQDSVGFLWFGSQLGLYRYDGQNIRTYRHNPNNPNSLASDYIEYIFLDSRGILWLTHYTDGGLTAFDPATETFTRYYHDPRNAETLSSNTNSVVAEDRDGYIWVGGQAGLDRLDRKTGKVRRFQHDPADPRSLSYNYVRALYVDKRGTLWAGTGFPWDANDPELKLGGLNRYDPKTESFTRYLHDPADPASLVNNKIRGLLEDRKGNFWVGTCSGGLHLLDRENGTFTRLTFESLENKAQSATPGHLIKTSTKPMPFATLGPVSHVTSIFEDHTGRIWITAYPGGLYIYDPSTGITCHIRVGKKEGELSTGFLWKTLQTKDGVIWMATGGAGGKIFKVTPQDSRFSFQGFQNVGISLGDHLTALLKDSAGKVWLGYSNGAPLIRYDRKTGKAFCIPFGSPPNGFSARTVSSLSLDADGFLWIGTEKGLFRRDPLTGKFRHYLAHFTDSWFSSVVQDRQGYIWAPEWNTGLYRLDPVTGNFVRFLHDPVDPKSLGGNSVKGLHIDKQDQLWVGGGEWYDLAFPLFIDRFNPGEQNFTRLIREKEAGSGMNINSDPLSAGGDIWFVTNAAGIQKINPTNGRRQKFSVPNENLARLGGQGIIAFAKGSDGSFWLYNNNRLFHFDPETEQFYTLGEMHGIHPVGASHSNLFVAADGEMLIAGERGLLAFYPENIATGTSSRPPNLCITDFRLLGEPVVPGQQHPDILKKPIWQTAKIYLPHDQNVFDFSVACFDFYDPAASQIEFMLEGYDRTGWRKDLREGQTPSYVNVPPGTYTFRVRGADSHGVWNKEGITLRIIVLPPWWKTWWAYTFYLLVFTGSVFGFIYWRSAALRRENRVLEEKVTLRTKQLQQSLETLQSTQSQLIQSEKLASLGELTAGIAHEIQNPLNFVNNFSELSVDLANEINEEVDKEPIDKAFVKELMSDLTQNQQKINLHGKRAASIVTGMLQHARSSTGKKEPTDLNALADEYLRLAYHGLRAKDPNFNAAMETHFDPAVGKVDVIPQDMGRVLLNLINNAFYAVSQKTKHGQEGYEPAVAVSTQKIDNQVVIKVKDNGTGIPDDVKARVFQPFFTTKPTGQGTGLGLSLAYDIVVKGHGGTLEVESMEGAGTEFVMRLPF